MAIENRFFNYFNDVGVVAQMLCFSLRRTWALFLNKDIHKSKLLQILSLLQSSNVRCIDLIFKVEINVNYATGLYQKFNKIASIYLLLIICGCFNLSAQNEIKCFDILSPILLYTDFESNFNEDNFLEDLKNCLDVNKIKLDIFRYLESDYHVFNKYSNRFEIATDVPFLIEKMHTKSKSCSANLLKYDFSNSLGKPFVINKETFFVSISY